jgi:hypothetical protein
MYAGVSPPNREQSQGIELLLYEIYMVFWSKKCVKSTFLRQILSISVLRRAAMM